MRLALLMLAILASGCASPQPQRAEDVTEPPPAAGIVPLTVEQDRMLAE